jgi:hypothetical protein
MVRLGSAELGVHCDAAARVGFQAGRLEPEVGGCGLAAGGVEDDLRRDAFPPAQVRDDTACVTLDGGDFLAEPEDDPKVAEVILQRLDDLGVDEVEETRALLDHRHLDTQGGGHRRVLEADDATSHDGHRLRDALEI